MTIKHDQAAESPNVVSRRGAIHLASRQSRSGDQFTRSRSNPSATCDEFGTRKVPARERLPVLWIRTGPGNQFVELSARLHRWPKDSRIGKWFLSREQLVDRLALAVLGRVERPFLDVERACGEMPIAVNNVACRSVIVIGSLVTSNGRSGAVSP